MIELPEPRLLSGTAEPRAAAPERPQAPARLPVPAGLGRLMVLAAVFVCAACGLVYELELVALASSLLGDSVTQASVVLSLMVFAMGVGSLLAKRLRCRAALAFGLVEAALALIGGCSGMALHASFAWLGQPRAALVAFSLSIGVLIGAEVPLLMVLIQRVRRQDAGGAVADLFAADYVGALVGGLAFPFLLLPLLGQLSGALLTGAVNAAAGAALVLWLFRRDLSPRSRWILITANVLVMAVLASGTVLADRFERAARRAVYGAEVRVALRTDVQEIVLTGGVGGPGPRGSFNLFFDGRLRAGGRDGHRYHEALVHPAMAGPHARVLVLGGGDGLALREVLRYDDVRSVTVVDPDPGVLRLARTDPGLTRFNRGSLSDPRVRTVSADVFGWLRGAAGAGGPGPYDVILSDLPGPGVTDSSKLYSQEFYGLAKRSLARGGRLAVHAGAPGAYPRAYWTVEATLRSAGFGTAPYRVTGGAAQGGAGARDAGGAGDAPGAGPDPGPRAGFRAGAGAGSGAGDAVRDWGLVLAARRTAPPLRLAGDTPGLRWLTARALRSAAVSARKTAVRGLPPSTLMHPRY